MSATHEQRTPSYRHTQRAPLCWGLYLICLPYPVASWLTADVAMLSIVFAVAGLTTLWLAASFHYLTTEDQGDRLSVRFGPLPTFRRGVRYDQIEKISVGRTTIFDGWGIHYSPRRGWVWNLWGRQCVVIQMRQSTLRVGSDDAAGLAKFLESRVG